jgi:hypothetical protein
MKNTELIAEEVVPHFRESGGMPAWSSADRDGTPAAWEGVAASGPLRRSAARSNGRLAGAIARGVAQPTGQGPIAGQPAIASFTATGLARRCGPNSA